MEEYTLQTPEPSRAEMDPHLYWSSLVRAVRRALIRARTRPADVEALAVSSQGETLVPVSASGVPLGPAIVWLDNRAVAEAGELAAQLDPGAVYAATGVPTMVPTWPACKLLWWKRHDADLFRSSARFLLVEEFLLQRLTGRYVAEAGVQSSSLLYDIAHHAWWQPMFDLLGISPSRFGDLVAPGTVVGCLTPAAAEALGLTTSVRVVAGGMDQGAGAVGVGNVAPGVLSESTGGALAVQASLDRSDRDASGRIPVYVHSAPGTYLYCPVCPTGGMALTWFRDHFGEPEMAREKAEGTSAYDLLTGMAAGVPPGADGLIMLPHLSGAFSPEYEPAARGVFFGFTLGHGREHFVRATLEAVAFTLRRNLELLQGIGASCRGGALAWRRCPQRSLESDQGRRLLPAGGDPPGDRGRGARRCHAGRGGLGELPRPGEACGAAVRPEARYEPYLETHAAYEAAYRLYIELFDSLRSLFRWAEPPLAAPEGASRPASLRQGSREEVT